MATPIQAHIVVERGRICSVNPTPGRVRVTTEKSDQTFDNAWLLPGLVDAHGHIMGLGMKLCGVDLSNAESAEECVQLILESQSSSSVHRGEWLYGRGWNNESWDNKDFPSKEILDSTFPNSPVVLVRIDGHAVWCNSTAIRIAGISSYSSRPHRSDILCDDLGNPTGILLDDAMDFVMSQIPPYSHTQLEEFLSSATNELASCGITEVHDMDVFPEWLELFRSFAERGKMKVRVSSYVRSQSDEHVSNGILPSGGELHRIAGIKLFADGALGSRGAHLLLPYSDSPKSRGLELLSEKVMFEKCSRAVESGMDIAIHAIGCAANRSILNVFEKLRKEGIATSKNLFRAEHGQIVDEHDLHRFADNRVGIAVQPLFFESDKFMAVARLGSRSKTAYRWKSLADTGVSIGGSSDFPIENHDPFRSISCLLKRTIPEELAENYDPEERLSMSEALHWYTVGAHSLTDMNYRRGKLSPKMDADFTVVDDGFLHAHAEDLSKKLVRATYVAGEQTFLSSKPTQLT